MEFHIYKFQDNLSQLWRNRRGDLSTQWTRLKSTMNAERKQKALADPESSLLRWAVVGYFFPRYPSAMENSHFARSPFAHPRAVFFSSSRLSPLPCLSIFQCFALASVTLASSPTDRDLPLPLPSVLLFLWISFGVFRVARETNSACRNEFHVSTDSLIAGGLDDRVNRRQRMSPFFLSSCSSHRKSWCKKVGFIKA